MLLLALLAVTESCSPAAAPKADPVKVARSFFDAVNAHDEAAFGKLLVPDSKFVMGPGPDDALDLSELLNVLNPGAHMDILQIGVAADGVVETRFHSSAGEDVNARIKVAGGCVTEFKQV